jgi:tRNA pseudouridine13 synthase
MQEKGILPTAVVRTTPADFVVDEIPAYEASGEGEHLFVTFRKTGLTTPAAVAALARALGTDVGDAGYAGLKDRHAVTTQLASFPFPAARSVDDALAALAGIEGIEVLAARRHGHKIRTGHLRGNRFTVVLRELAEGAAAGIAAALEASVRHGVPNAFGPQRYGRDGDNAERAIRWLGGAERPPRDRRQRRLLVSSLQSQLFDRVLERRIAEGTAARILPGDVAVKHDSGGVFTVPLEGAELDDAVARGERGEIAPTGPMFGRKMRDPSGHPADIEREVLATLPAPDLLDRAGRLALGARRPLVLPVRELGMDAGPGGAYLSVSFVLPKGGYATTFLSQACRLEDRTNRIER